VGKKWTGKVSKKTVPQPAIFNKRSGMKNAAFTRLFRVGGTKVKIIELILIPGF
jgi:hypothetical protein